MHKKYFYRNIIATLLLLTFAVSCSRAKENIAAFNHPQPPAILELNIAQNGGFESGAEHWSLKTAKVTVNQAHSGGHSLEYRNTNPKQYQLVMQSFPARPGDIIHFSAWVKGQNIKPSGSLYQEKGAGIFMQGYDSEGNYISGAFPFTLPGTYDWQQVKGIYVVPENADHVALGLYMRRHSVGVAWFDDVSVHVEKPRQYTAFLQYPNYRGLTKVGNTTPWKVLLKNHLAKSVTNAIAKSRIYNASGKVLFEDNLSIIPGKEQTIQWKPPMDLAAGTYSWTIQLPHSADAPAQKVLFPVHVQARMPKVYIDGAGFTVMNGKRFFPFGVYLGKIPGRGAWASSDESLKIIANGGFNTILDYVHGGRSGEGKQYLARAADHDLNVIYSFTDTYDGVTMNPNLEEAAIDVAKQRVEELKFAPNLLAWYINDEQGYGKLPATRAMYAMLQQTDPNHPVYQVQNKTALLPWDYYGSDILGTDPYPVRKVKSNLGSVTNSTNTVLQTAKGTKAVWQALQIHDMSFHKSNIEVPPTLEQMRNMSYQAIIAGSKGIIYYSYSWLWLDFDANGKKISSDKAFAKRWADVTAMTSEIKTLLPIVLQDQKVLLSQEGTSDAVYQAWQKGNQLFLVVANPKAENATLHIKVPGKWRLKSQDLPHGITAKVVNGVVQFQLGAIFSGVVEFEVDLE